MTAPPPPTPAEDRIAVLAAVCGCGATLARWHDPLALATGLALGVGGVALALRRRVSDGSRRQRWLLTVALAIALAAFLARAAAELAADWSLGELLSTGDAPAALVDRGRAYALALRILGAVSAASAGVFLVAALGVARSAARPRPIPPTGPAAAVEDARDPR